MTALELVQLLLQEIKQDPDTELYVDPMVVALAGDRMYAIDGVRPVNKDDNVTLNLRFIY